MKRKLNQVPQEKKRKTDAPPPALAAYGEQFMTMFDDYDEQQAKQVKIAPEEPDSAAEPYSEGTGTSEGSSESDGDADEVVAEQQAMLSSHKHAGPSHPTSKLDVFLSRRKGSHSGTAAAPSKSQLLAQQKQQEQQRLLEQKLKRQFMSSKVSKIFSDVDASQLLLSQSKEQDGLTADEFAQMKRDVELLGASALDKRSAKAWKASMLARLGAAAEKTPRTPAKIGHGLAKKAKQREAAALQEAIAAGMVQAKGRGKKMRALKAKQRDRGLMEAGPGFKNGVLRIGKVKKG